MHDHHQTLWKIKSIQKRLKQSDMYFLNGGSLSTHTLLLICTQYVCCRCVLIADGTIIVYYRYYSRQLFAHLSSQSLLGLILKSV